MITSEISVCVRKALLVLFIFSAFNVTYANLDSCECSWTSFQSFVENDTLYFTQERTNIIKGDSIFSGTVELLPTVKGNRLKHYFKQSIYDTLLLKGDSIVWIKNGMQGLFFRHTSFLRGDTFFVLRSNPSVVALKLIPSKEIIYEGRRIFKFKAIHVKYDTISESYSSSYHESDVFIDPLFAIIQEEKGYEELILDNFVKTEGKIDHYRRFLPDKRECESQLLQLEKRLGLR
ncbi:MAG: hypothetical protein WC150_02795 [Bacteroidia bacterium]